MTTNETTATTTEFQGFELREVIDLRTNRPCGVDVYRNGRRVYIGYASFAMAKRCIAAGLLDRA